MKEILDAIASLKRRQEQLRPYVEEMKRTEIALASLEKARQQLETQPNGDNPSGVQANGAQSLTVADLAEAVIREHGGEMQANELLEVLQGRGHKITQPVLSSAVMRFAKKGERFTRPKKGIYALINKTPADTPPITERGTFSNGRKNRGLQSFIEEMLPSLPVEFTRIDIRTKLDEKYPERAKKVTGDAMRAAFYALTKAKKIEVVRRGEGKVPTVYRAKISGSVNQSAVSELMPKQSKNSLTVLQKVRNTIKEIKGDITQREVTAKVLQKYPELTSRKNFNSTVSGMLKILTDKRELELARKGSGFEPYVYRRVL